MATVKILVCVDRFDPAKVAVQFATKLAKKRGFQLLLMHVIQPPAELGGLFGIGDIQAKEAEAEAQAMMAKLASEVSDELPSTPEILLRQGQIGDEIITAAVADPDIHLLVLGAAPVASASKGKLIGWLSSQLGSRLLIPLLVVPGNLTEQQIEELS